MALLRRLLEALVARRYLVYGGGVLAIVGASRLAPERVATPAVVLALTLMSVTYFAEVVARAEVDPRGAVLVAATAGVAVGAYLLVAVTRLGGLLFLGGSVLFFRAAATPAAGADAPDEDSDSHSGDVDFHSGDVDFHSGDVDSHSGDVDSRSGEGVGDR